MDVSYAAAFRSLNTHHREEPITMNVHVHAADCTCTAPPLGFTEAEFRQLVEAAERDILIEMRRRDADEPTLADLPWRF